MPKAARRTGRESYIVRMGRRTTELSMKAIEAARNPLSWRDLSLATLTGCLVFLSYPTHDLFYLQWFSLIPLLFVIQHRAASGSFWWGFWAGLVTNWGGFWWVTGMLMDFGHFSLTLAIALCTLLCAYQGLVFALWAGLTRWLVLRTQAPLLLVAALVWVVVEYALPFIFPWYMGNGQYLFLPAVQIAEITGVLGVSFLIVFVNTGLYLALSHVWARSWGKVWRPLVLALGLFAANTLYGVIRIDQIDTLMEEAPKLRIGVGEADVGIFEKEAKSLKSPTLRLNMLRGNIMKHHLLAAELEQVHEVDLIVEPESSFIPVPWPYQTVRFKRNDVFAVVGGRGRDVWMLEDRTWSGPQRAASDATAIRSLYAAREDQIFAVGDAGLVLRYDGAEWVREEVPVKPILYGVWAGELSPDVTRLDAAAVVAFAVGDSGTALVREAKNAWIRTETRTAATLRAVAGTGAQYAIAVGDRGTVLQWNGRSWTVQDVDTGVDLNAVALLADGTVVIAGDQGTVLTRRGSRWTRERLGESHLRAMATDGQQVFIAGDEGNIWMRVGSSWSRMATRTKLDLRAMSSDGRGNFYAVGERGIHLVLGPHAQNWEDVPRLRNAGDLLAVAGVPYTEAHAYARDARHVYRSPAPLPRLGPWDRLEAVADIGPLLSADAEVPPPDWNTPLRGFKTPILLGLLTYDPAEPGVSPLRDRKARHMYNSAVLLDPEGRVLGRYDKNYLLIFGEFIPMGDIFPSLYEWLPEASHFYAGDTVETFAFKGHQIGVMICYEDIIPRFTRRLAGKDPNVLINVTNDAWFGKTSEPYLHMALSAMRAVENRLWLIRSTNTGVSVYIDAVGRLVSQTRLEDPEVLAEDVPMMRTNTVYRSWGDLFGYLCVLAFAILTIGGLARGRREKVRKKAAQPQPKKKVARKGPRLKT